jgi:S1-C subfamily serine protease
MLIGWLLTPAAGGAALAQPALDRLEEMIQSQEVEAPGEQGQPRPSDGAPAPGAAAPSEREVQEPGYLGVKVDDQDDRGQGVLIMEVFPDSPAQRSGLQSEDVITAVGGRQVRTMDDMAAILARIPPGRKVALEILRGQARRQFDVTLERYPPPDPAPEERQGAPAEPAESIQIVELLRRLEKLETRVQRLEQALLERQ